MWSQYIQRVTLPPSNNFKTNIVFSFSLIYFISGGNDKYFNESISSYYWFRFRYQYLKRCTMRTYGHRHRNSTTIHVRPQRKVNERGILVWVIAITIIFTDFDLDASVRDLGLDAEFLTQFYTNYPLMRSRVLKELTSNEGTKRTVTITLKWKRCGGSREKWCQVTQRRRLNISTSLISMQKGSGRFTPRLRSKWLKFRNIFMKILAKQEA